MIYCFHGPDTFGRAEALASLKTRLFAEDPFAELNYTELEGQRATFADLQVAANALPFLGPRRLVVVRGLLARCSLRAAGSGEGTELAKALIAWLPELPPTTRLVFMDEAMPGSNGVLRWAQTRPTRADGKPIEVMVRAFPAPGADALPRWLSARAAAKGGAIEPAAGQALAEALAVEGVVDLRLADNELEKLLTYAADRPVSASDVALLITPVSLDKVFAFTDALARRDGPAAADLLQTFLANNEPPLRLMALVARQIRHLVIARALMGAGSPADALSGHLGLPPYVARKIADQARRFERPSPVAALRRLLELETDIKTGRTDAGLALELFVAGVCGQKAGGGRPELVSRPSGGSTGATP